MTGSTVLEGEEEFKKFDFQETFDWSPFTEMSSVCETDKNGKVKIRLGECQMKSEIGLEVGQL
jgi:hypothetical protein